MACESRFDRTLFQGWVRAGEFFTFAFDPSSISRDAQTKAGDRVYFRRAAIPGSSLRFNQIGCSQSRTQQNTSVLLANSIGRPPPGQPTFSILPAPPQPPASPHSPRPHNVWPIPLAACARLRSVRDIGSSRKRHAGARRGLVLAPADGSEAWVCSRWNGNDPPRPSPYSRLLSTSE